MATKTIISDQSATNVPGSSTPLYTSTKITYTLDENGKVDPNKIKQEILYQQVSGDPPVVAATRNGTTGDFTFNKNGITGETYFGADAQKSLQGGALKNNTQQQIKTASQKEGLTPEQIKAISGASNIGTNPGNGDSLRGSLESELKASKQRDNYDNLKYPLDLKSDKQDCIKFSIINYIPATLGPQVQNRRNITIQNGTPEISGRTLKGSITLPIPGNISDRNPVNWQEDRIDELSRAFSDIALKGITVGPKGAIQSATETLNSTDAKTLSQFTAAKFTEIATGTSNILSRQYGAIINPNLELLFTGPSLRSFSFLFKMSPRSSNEAIQVRKIIRTFKQAMSVKRSESTLLLKAPHTFAISYISSNKAHPYLNKFKECALTDCSINYTPEGTYMTYDGEPSMVAYELTLTFQELEPVFDDDYPNDNDASIGY